MRYILAAALLLTSCTQAYVPPSDIDKPMSVEEQRKHLLQQRQDMWTLGILAILPGAIIASK